VERRDRPMPLVGPGSMEGDVFAEFPRTGQLGCVRHGGGYVGLHRGVSAVGADSEARSSPEEMMGSVAK
jgi:hypothetical protein